MIKLKCQALFSLKNNKKKLEIRHVKTDPEIWESPGSCKKVLYFILQLISILSKTKCLNNSVFEPGLSQDMAISLLQNLASENENHRKRKQWNDRMTHLVNHSSR